MDEESKKKYELKKQLEVLRSMKGTGTELISVYMPPGYAVHEVANKLREEAGQASNIKSKSTRKNVTDALERILQHLKLYRQAPENGMAIFCGNVSENPARTDIELYTVFPHEKINVQLYRCDSRFFLEPLERLLDVKDSYGLLVMDGREATLAVLRGTNVQIVRKLNSTAHAKIRKGGQCLAPDTMVALSDGRLLPVGSIEAGEWIKGADLSRFEVGDWVCSDRFETRAKKAYRIVAHAPKMEIVATAWHRFFTVGENGARETYAKDLKIGDRVLVAKKMRHEGKGVKIGFKPTFGLRLDDAEFEKLREKRAHLGLAQAKVAQMLGVSQMAVCRMERGEIQLSAGKIREMYKLYGMWLEEGKFIEQPLKLPHEYTPQLAYLLGVISGDGSLDGNRVCIYESYPKMVERYEDIVQKAIGIKAKTYKVDKRGQKGCFAKKEYYEMRIYSKDFAQFIKSEIPQIVASSDTRCVPQQIQKSPLRVQAAFLAGLYDAEGYMHARRVEIAMCSLEMMRQLQAILLRFGIRASCGQKKVKGNPQWCVSISDRESLRSYAREIGFFREDKAKKLRDAAEKAINNQHVEQVPVDGREVYAFAKSMGLKTSNFHAASNFFRNKKPLGREAFLRNIAPVLLARAGAIGKMELAQKLLGKWMSEGVGVARIAQKVPIRGEREYVDLTVPNAFNFVANGFIVHNSANRYARLIEESIELYYKRIGDQMDAYFLTGLKGVIVGGPGPAKDDFIKMKPFNYQIKVMGVVDTGYTDEYGVRELMAKSTDIIAGQEAVKERALVERFIKEVVSSGLATYGEASVREALSIKKAQMLLVSEDLPYERVTYACQRCAAQPIMNVKKGDEKKPLCPACGTQNESDVKKQDSTLKEISRENLADNLIALAESTGAKVEVISSNTAEGSQFLQMFYGVGAFLRYR